MDAEHDKANCYVCRRAWNGLASWRTIAAAAFSGLAISILCATLGAAVGVTSSVETEQAANRLAIESGVGTGIWMFVTAIVVATVRVGLRDVGGRDQSGSVHRLARLRSSRGLGWRSDGRPTAASSTGRSRFPGLGSRTSKRRAPQAGLARRGAAAQPSFL